MKKKFEINLISLLFAVVSLAAIVFLVLAAIKFFAIADDYKKIADSILSIVPAVKEEASANYGKYLFDGIACIAGVVVLLALCAYMFLNNGKKGLPALILSGLSIAAIVMLIFPMKDCFMIADAINKNSLLSEIFTKLKDDAAIFTVYGIAVIVAICAAALMILSVWFAPKAKSKKRK